MHHNRPSKHLPPIIGETNQNKAVVEVCNQLFAVLSPYGQHNPAIIQAALGTLMGDSELASPGFIMNVATHGWNRCQHIIDVRTKQLKAQADAAVKQ